MYFVTILFLLCGYGNAYICDPLFIEKTACGCQIPQCQTQIACQREICNIPVYEEYVIPTASACYEYARPNYAVYEEYLIPSSPCCEVARPSLCQCDYYQQEIPLINNCGCQKVITKPVNGICDCCNTCAGSYVGSTSCACKYPFIDEFPAVLGYECMPPLPPALGCGKYLRQCTLQPPFL
ncbi:unnamed protein product [Colias eurytheme]|nr:unnamed protein product [Colias eurytheme]